jgi:hypothetical protein
MAITLTAQMVAPIMRGPAGCLQEPHRHQLQQQQTSSRLFVQQGLGTAARGFNRPTDTVITYPSIRIRPQANPQETELSFPQQYVPGPSTRIPFTVAETDISRFTSDIAFSDSSINSPPKDHQNDKKLYDLQQYDPGPSVIRSYTPTVSSTHRPFSRSASHTMDSSLYQNLLYANRPFQQNPSFRGPSKTQPNLPIAMRPTDIQYGRPSLPYQFGSFLHQQQPSLPRQNIQEPILPAAGSAPHCSDTVVSSLRDLLSARTTQSTPLPQASMPLGRREQQEVHVTPSRVSNST